MLPPNRLGEGNIMRALDWEFFIIFLLIIFIVFCCVWLASKSSGHVVLYCLGLTCLLLIVMMAAFSDVDRYYGKYEAVIFGPIIVGLIGIVPAFIGYAFKRG